MLHCDPPNLLPILHSNFLALMEVISAVRPLFQLGVRRNNILLDKTANAKEPTRTIPAPTPGGSPGPEPWAGPQLWGLPRLLT